MKKNYTHAGLNSFSKKLFFSTLVICSQLALAEVNRIDVIINEEDRLAFDKTNQPYNFAKSSMVSVNGQAAIQIDKMSTRGQGSLSAKRKNLGMSLKQAIQVDGVYGKDINLVNMWVDKGYISTRLGFLTANHLDIGKKQESAYAEVFINGHSNGLYTVVEKPAKVVKNSPFVVRRRGKSLFEVAKAGVSKDYALDEVSKSALASQIGKKLQAGYNSIDSISGEKLWKHLENALDIEAYMRLMVLNSLYRNGDGADEVFFYLDKETYDTQNGKLYFKILPWDSDDLFKEYHQKGNPNSTNSKYFAKYPESLIYNFEDRLDRKFADDPYLYEKLKQVTKQLLSTGGLLDKANTDALLNQLRDELSPYLSHRDVLTMGALDGGRKGLAYSKSEILNIIELRRNAIDERRAILLARASK